MPDGQEIDLYPPNLFKKFLTKTKGMKGLDLGTYFPDRLCFIRDRGIEADWEKEWEGQVQLSHNTTLSGGVGLLFSRGFTPLSLEGDTRRSIKDLEAIGSSTGDRGCIEILQSKKMALASLLDNQVQGTLVRSRIQDLTEMDAPSIFFFGLEKKRGQNLIIHSLFSSTGQELVEPGQIRKQAVEFFSSLYEIHMCFVDLEKAFDRVPWGVLWGVLREYGVSGPLIRALRSLYDRCQSLVRIAGSKSNSFPEEILPQVEEFKYLGVLFTSEGRMEREINRRIGAASAVMRTLHRSVVVKRFTGRSSFLPSPMVMSFGS
ncbi:hypothetical protein D4764_11G0003190 [Takifugu flavidus]|uniref:Reverse transcriptase domain-containing protein n=1 Tax=Takifugu flavidus TaxID=433684 RepID=A0A5C6PHN5_9TELE|nr:hypothetical protein D4764_11G0003190 [Takifugu flavidus]